MSSEKTQNLQTGADSVHDFIVSLEARAKRILKEADKKRREELRIEHQKKYVNKNSSKKLAQTGSILMPLIDNSISSSTIKLPSASETVDKLNTLNSKLKDSPTKLITKTQKLHYSVPKLSVSLTADTVNLDELALSGVVRPGSVPVLEPIRPGSAAKTIRKTGAAQTFDKSFLSQSVEVKKTNKTLKKLDTSPFISGSATNLDEFLTTKKKEEKKAANPLFESTWSLKCHATDVLSGKQQSNTARIQSQQAKNSTLKNKSKKSTQEPQGPVDWSTRGLRSKYRGEIERENLWHSWSMANSYADSAVDNGGLILSVAKVERHPLYVLYNKFIEIENTKSFRRTRARLRMKRFVLDVQEIWLTNLQHLREHQPGLLLTEKPMEDIPGSGLSNRRDTQAIKGMDSQIQSVSIKRAMQHTFYPPDLDPPAVILDYIPGSTPSLIPPEKSPHLLENLIDGLSISINENIKDTHLLFIDRLLPSAQSLSRDVLWRVTVMQKENVQFTYFYTTEKKIEEFLESSRVLSNVTNDYNIPRDVYIKEKDILKWSIMDLDVIYSIKLHVSPDNFQKIVVTITATLSADFNYDVLAVTTDTAKLLSIYPEHCPGPGVLNNIEWWSGSEAQGIWDSIFPTLYVKDDEYNDQDDPYPMTLLIQSNRTAASAVPEAVDTAQAFSLTADLTKFIHISASNSNQLNISIHSSNKTIISEFNTFDESWELVADHIPSLSLRVSGKLSRNAQVPGSCDYGKLGLWFTYRHDKERTQSSASFFRDSETSSTNSVQVLMTLALDTPILVPTTTAWEDFSEAPAKVPGETADGVIPPVVARPKALYLDQLVSPITQRLTFPVAIFNTLPIEGVDHIPLTSPTLPEGMQRHWPYRNKFGFRRKLIHNLLGVDIVLPTIVFGITRSGAVANQTGVTVRNIWHSILAVVEHINRPRTAIDYLYIIQNSSSRGSNNPNAFSVLMKGGEFFELFCANFSKYEDEYAEINERRKIFARQVALSSKIEISEIALKTKERLLQAQIIKEKQRAIEKKLRKATKSEKGWRRRFKMSVFVEIQGNWEKRKDYYSGAFFFHQIQPSNNLYYQHDAGDHDQDDDIISLDGGSTISSSLGKISNKKGNHHLHQKKEQYLQTCQWKVPAVWEGDPLSDTGAPSHAGNIPDRLQPHRGQIPDGENDSQSGISLSGDSEMGYVHRENYGNEYQTAFQEPKDNWVPGGDFSVLDDQTPGVKTATVLPRPTKENDRKDLMPGSSPYAPQITLESISRAGEKSFKGDDTINSSNMEQIAEHLLKSDELIRILAKRLGLPTNNLVPVDDLPSIFSTGSEKNNKFNVVDVKTKAYLPIESNGSLPAPREAFEDDGFDPEFDSDDDLWSDDDYEAGDHDMDTMGQLPQGHQDVLKMKLATIKESKAGSSKIESVPSKIPYLNLKDKSIGGSYDDEENSQAAGWRRLARPEISTSFHAKLLLRRTIGPDNANSNKPNNCTYLLPISPVDACEYEPRGFEANVESIFIPNAKKDMERAIATLARNIKREEELAKNIPTDDLILFGKASENTSSDLFLAKQYKQDQDAFVDPREAAIDKAIMAAKASNITEMEDALEEDIPVNCSDPHGNTLLLLAAQQGSKRLCKFLLRRGANINAQNLAGNTVLHFCFTYSHTELGNYLMQRGADDSILNCDGMTCYEGLGLDALDDPY